MSSSAATDSWTTLLDDPDICEVGGEHTNDGVDYARFLAMVLLVEMEKAELPDYALLFEYLQDIAIVDSSSAPTKATLLQVKKKGKGNWTKALLCKNEATESGSGVAGEKGQDSSLTGEENGASAPAKKKHSPQLGARSLRHRHPVDNIPNVVRNDVQQVFPKRPAVAHPTPTERMLHRVIQGIQKVFGAGHDLAPFEVREM